MGQRQCEKCDEMVDEAKAFCPGCGHAFVTEEKRKDASNFDKVDHTVQFGKTMYNQMLEDMGLNIGAVPSSAAKHVETIAPVNTETTAPAAKGGIAQPPVVKEPQKPSKEGGGSGSKAKWYIFIG